jgi:hypothetical protein
MPFDAPTYLLRVAIFDKAARGLLATHATSRDRVISLSSIQNDVDCLSIDQNELFSESITCIKHGLFRPAIVVAWAAMMDYLESTTIKYKLEEIHASYPKWGSISSAQDLRESQNDHNIIEAAATVKVLRKSEKKVLHGHLAKRNECAHPGAHQPSLNESIGYVDELLRRIATINNRLLATVPSQP